MLLKKRNGIGRYCGRIHWGPGSITIINRSKLNDYPSSFRGYNADQGAARSFC